MPARAPEAPTRPAPVRAAAGAGAAAQLTPLRRAPAPQNAHRGVGEDCTYVEPVADRNGMATVGVVNEKRRFGVKIEYSTKQFPRLVNWQHWGPGGSYVGALEPVNGGVEGRPTDRERGWLDEAYVHTVERGHAGLSGMISFNGGIDNICPGTSTKSTEQGYLDKEPRRNDSHGIGPVLLGLYGAMRVSDTAE